jgi:site-specific DNA-cytosine methylase
MLCGFSFGQDMFAGIGSGIVALKRLGIQMQTIIHVEHDPVANHGTDSSQFEYCESY